MVGGGIFPTTRYLGLLGIFSDYYFFGTTKFFGIFPTTIFFRLLLHTDYWNKFQISRIIIIHTLLITPWIGLSACPNYCSRLMWKSARRGQNHWKIAHGPPPGRRQTRLMSGLPADNVKSEDPAKMTYSISDFVSRNGFNLPIYCQYLEGCGPGLVREGGQSGVYIDVSSDGRSIPGLRTLKNRSKWAKPLKNCLNLQQNRFYSQILSISATI